MLLLKRSLLGLLAALVFASSIATADTIRPTHSYDDDWEPRVLRFTQQKQDEAGY